MFSNFFLCSQRADLKTNQKENPLTMAPMKNYLSNDFEERLRKQFIRSLLEQQNEHQKMGIFDPKGLFQFSKTASKAARQRAIDQAKEMEKEIREETNHFDQTRAVLDDVLGMLDFEL